MDQNNVASGSPTAGAGPIAVRPLRFAAGFAACCYAPICAYCWATSRDGEPPRSSLVSLMVGTALAGVFLVSLAIGLARIGRLRLALPAVPGRPEHL